MPDLQNNGTETAKLITFATAVLKALKMKSMLLFHSLFFCSSNLSCLRNGRFMYNLASLHIVIKTVHVKSKMVGTFCIP